MILTVFAGQSCVAAGTEANNSPDNAKAKRLFIEFSRSPECSIVRAVCGRAGGSGMLQ
jgi:hypothetical protein